MRKVCKKCGCDFDSQSPAKKLDTKMNCDLLWVYKRLDDGFCENCVYQGMTLMSTCLTHSSDVNDFIFDRFVKGVEEKTLKQISFCFKELRHTLFDTNCWYVAEFLETISYRERGFVCFVLHFIEFRQVRLMEPQMRKIAEANIDISIFQEWFFNRRQFLSSELNIKLLSFYRYDNFYNKEKIIDDYVVNYLIFEFDRYVDKIIVLSKMVPEKMLYSIVNKYNTYGYLLRLIKTINQKGIDYLETLGLNEEKEFIPKTFLEMTEILEAQEQIDKLKHEMKTVKDGLYKKMETLKTKPTKGIILGKKLGIINTEDVVRELGQDIGEWFKDNIGSVSYEDMKKWDKITMDTGSHVDVDNKYKIYFKFMFTIVHEDKIVSEKKYQHGNVISYTNGKLVSETSDLMIFIALILLSTDITDIDYKDCDLTGIELADDGGITDEIDRAEIERKQQEEDEAREKENDNDRDDRSDYGSSDNDRNYYDNNDNNLVDNSYDHASNNSWGNDFF